MSQLQTDPPRPLSALTWVEEDSVTGAGVVLHPDAAVQSQAASWPPLLPKRQNRAKKFVRGALIGAGSLAVAAGVYVLTVSLWPMDAFAPTIRTNDVVIEAAAASALSWPEAGGAAVSVSGFNGLPASNEHSFPIASITKLITAHVVQKELQLSPENPGRSHSYTWEDENRYWGYLNRGESALPYPVDGSLTDYELLQGMLISSANNYAADLVSEIWESDEAYLAAVNAWMSESGLSGISITESSGFDAENTASAASLLPLAQLTVDDPVLGPIVATQQLTLPGVGEIETTNALLGDPGVVGVKTGSLWDVFNLLAAKKVTINGAELLLSVSTLAQPSDEERNTVSRDLLAQLEKELLLSPVIPAGTQLGTVSTAWGESAVLKTDADVPLVLWNGTSASTSLDLLKPHTFTAGEELGVLSVAAPLGAQEVNVVASADVAGPTIWWRITNPALVFGW